MKKDTSKLVGRVGRAVVLVLGGGLMVLSACVAAPPEQGPVGEAQQESQGVGQSCSAFLGLTCDTDLACCHVSGLPVGSGYCRDLFDDLDNCGFCGNVCNNFCGPGTVRACSGGSCTCYGI